MILGLYYTTIMREGMMGEGMIFSSIEEVQYALDTGLVHLHAKVTARVPQIDDEGNEIQVRYETTPGRVRLGALLPHNSKAPFDLVNELMRKKDVQRVIDTVYRYCGQKESVIFCDQIMTMGFREPLRRVFRLARTTWLCQTKNGRWLMRPADRLKTLNSNIWMA